MDLLQLGCNVSLTFLLSFHQEIDLLFFSQNIVRVNLPGQNRSDDPSACAWLGSDQPSQTAAQFGSLLCAHNLEINPPWETPTHPGDLHVPRELPPPLSDKSHVQPGSGIQELGAKLLRPYSPLMVADVTPPALPDSGQDPPSCPAGFWAGS